MNEAATAPSPTLFPRLIGERVILRPGLPEDAVAMRKILFEPAVMQWWGEPGSVEHISGSLRGEEGENLLVIEVDGVVVGGIQYSEENEPDYRHASIDIYLGTSAQGRGLGTEAMRLMVRFLIDVRHHHRLTIDPAASNERAIRCYASVGFRPVGIMRQYERGRDGVFHDGLLMDLLADEVTG